MGRRDTCYQTDKQHRTISTEVELLLSGSALGTLVCSIVLHGQHSRPVNMLTCCEWCTVLWQLWVPRWQEALDSSMFLWNYHHRMICYWQKHLTWQVIAIWEVKRFLQGETGCLVPGDTASEMQNHRLSPRSPTTALESPFSSPKELVALPFPLLLKAGQF